MNMYEPIITLYEKASRELEQRKEDAVFAAIAEIGVQVNKDELIRALKFDRDQYNKGFADGVKEGSPKWISVEERLPENGQWVLTYCGEYVKWSELNKWCGACWLKTLPITHWLPLPELPKEGEHENA